MNYSAVLTHAAAFHDPNFRSQESLSNTQKAVVEEINRKLDSKALGLEALPCLCGSEEFALIARFDRYRNRLDSVICRKCGLIQSRPRLSKNAAKWFYETCYTTLYRPSKTDIDRAKFDEAVNLKKGLFKFIHQNIDVDRIRRVLEVGCAGGWNLYPFHASGKTVVGYDPDLRLTAYGRSLGMDLRDGDLDVNSEGNFDLVILSHVFEHLHDPVGTLKTVVRKLAPNGCVYIEVPNADQFCLGGLQIAHNYWFSPQTLDGIAVGAGLVPIATSLNVPHMRALYSVSKDPVLPSDANLEYHRMSRIILANDRKERIKALLDRFGLLKFIRSVL